MKLSGDIQSVRLLHLKGWLFLLIALLSALLIFAESPHVKTILLTGLLAWSASRFYYYLFYVLEKYAGSGRPYAGVLDAFRAFRAKRK